MGGGTIEGWRPTFKISEYLSACPNGWKSYDNHCYKENDRHGHFKADEELCNKMKAHIYVPSNKAEHEWVNANVVTRNDWYWVGTWCSDFPSQDPSTFYTVSG